MTRPHFSPYVTRTDADRVRGIMAAPLHPERAGKRRFTLRQAVFILAIVGAFVMGLAW